MSLKHLQFTTLTGPGNGNSRTVPTGRGRGRGRGVTRKTKQKVCLNLEKMR